jgi:hypothetical protein
VSRLQAAAAKSTHPAVQIAALVLMFLSPFRPPQSPAGLERLPEPRGVSDVLLRSEAIADDIRLSRYRPRVSKRSSLE